MPQWQERHAADLGIALVEALAYVGDYLSYRQDAVATEAYLGTARSRVSVRRHARLVDYRMHEGVKRPSRGCTFRLRPTPSCPRERRSSPRSMACRAASRPARRLTAARSLHPLKCSRRLHEGKLFAGHNEIRFYTWGNARCCLPAGATRATLLGSFPNLKVE